MVARARTESKFKKYRENLKKEAAALKRRLRGAFAHVSVRYYNEPKTDSEGKMVLDDFGQQIKVPMKSVAPPYRNENRLHIKMDRKHRRFINKGKAMQRRMDLRMIAAGCEE